MDGPYVTGAPSTNNRPVEVMSPSGLEAVFLANRDKLIRFLAARGAGEAAEDLVHDLWVKLSARPEGPIGSPAAYLFRAADTLMIDRYRAKRQAELRDHAWQGTRQDGEASAEPDAERAVAARQEAAQVMGALAALGPRRETVFRRARLDDVPQRVIAEEMGVSLSTVESDLRVATRTLAELKDRIR